MLSNASHNSSADEAAECGEPWYPGLLAYGTDYGRLHGYIAAGLCVLGIAANIANVVVLTQRHMVSATNIILTGLAVADMLTMASSLPVSVHFYIMKPPGLVFPETFSLHWIRFLIFHINFSVLCHTIAIWLTIALATFRYLFICFPTRGAVLCSQERAKLAVALVSISTAVICVPNYMSSRIATTTNEPPYAPLDNVTALPPPATKYNVGDAQDLVTKANFWIQAILIKLIPCGLLTVLTMLLVVAMHRANQRRMKLKSQGKKDESERAREHQRTTAMLLAIVALFLLTELPQGILTLCNIFVPCFYPFIYWPLGDTLDFMALLNNSVNFVLYCSMSSQFRNTFTTVFGSACAQTGGWLKVKTSDSKGLSTTATNTGASCAQQV